MAKRKDPGDEWVARWDRIDAVSRIFSPSAPIDNRDLFAGRIEQIRDAMVALNQKGQHVILYGERGVGKTSLSNIIQVLMDRPTSHDFTCVNINCDVSDDFSKLWHKVFRQMWASVERPRIGYAREIARKEVPLHEMLPDVVSPDDVRYMLDQLPKPTIIIIDEIDTIRDKDATALMSHTIKSLSDHAIKSKVVLVGVADSVEELINEHRSVERSLVQVRMPRMSREELFELIDKALQKVTMTIEEHAKNVIAQLSHGLPHYTHSLGLYAAIKAIEGDRGRITLADVYAATSDKIEKSANNNQTIASAFAKANRGTKNHKLHAKVLLACALAETDGLGTFSAVDAREPLSTLAGRSYGVGGYQRHLDDFSCERRGPVLKKMGTRGVYRYRFMNPMLPPYVVIQGIRSGALQGDALQKFVLSRSRT